MDVNSTFICANVHLFALWEEFLSIENMYTSFANYCNLFSWRQLLISFEQKNLVFNKYVCMYNV